MLPVALDILRGVLQVAELAAMAFGVTLAIAILFGERERVLIRHRARRAVKAYGSPAGLRLVERDELSQRRDRRCDRGTAA